MNLAKGRLKHRGPMQLKRGQNILQRDGQATMKCKQVATRLIKRIAQATAAGILALGASGVFAQVVAPPAGMSVTTSPGRTAQISWLANSDAGCASYTYDLQRSSAPSGQSYNTIATVSGTSYTDSLQSLLQYNYKLVANCTPSIPGPVISSAPNTGLGWSATLMPRGKPWRASALRSRKRYLARSG